VHIHGDDIITLEASPNGVYEDAGAHCVDQFDDNIDGNVLTVTTTSFADDFGVCSTSEPVNVSSSVTVCSDATCPHFHTFAPNDTYNGEVYNGTSTCDGVTIDKSKVGIYTISYMCTNSFNGTSITANRTVYIEDTEAPVCTYNGSSSMTVEASFPYVDDGINCIDPTYGDGDDIVIGVVDGVNVEKTGTYTVSYTATDSNCQESQYMRTVVVKDNLKPVLGIYHDSPHPNNLLGVGEKDENNPAYWSHVGTNMAEAVGETSKHGLWQFFGLAAGISGLLLVIFKIDRESNTYIPEV
jgi:hypothetical protein